MSGPRLYWPKKLADVPGFPAELVGPLAAHKITTVADLVARVKRSHPYLTPPASAIGVTIRCLPPITGIVCGAAGRAVAEYLGYGEYSPATHWTDPPASTRRTAETEPKPEPTMPQIEYVKPQSLELHPEAKLVPEMPADQYKAFLKDVKDKGFIEEPLKRIKGTNTVIDGRTRRQAAIDAGFAQVPVTDADLGDEDPVIYMMRVALFRRHLKGAALAKFGNEFRKKLTAEMRRRKKEGGKKGGAKSAAVRAGKLAAEVPQASAEKKTRAPGAREQAAALSGASPKAIDTAAKIEAKAPEVYAKLGTAEIPTLAAAKKAAKIEEPKKKPAAPKLGKPLKEIAGFPAKLAAAADDAWISTDIQLNQLIDRDPDSRWKGKSNRDRVLMALTSVPNADPAECVTGTEAYLDYIYPGRKKDHFTNIKPEEKAKDTPTAAANVPELKPCPFCGGDDEVLDVQGEKHRRYVTCHSCGSNGPIEGDEETAVDEWNKRAEKK